MFTARYEINPEIQFELTLDILEYFNHLGSAITKDARCTNQIKSMISMAKAAFNK